MNLPPIAMAPVRIDNTIAYNAFPTLTPDKRGRLHVFYTSGTNHSSNDLVLKHGISVDGGKTWTITTITTSLNYVTDAHAVLLPNGNIGLVYTAINSASTVFKVYYRFSTDDGETFLPEQLVIDTYPSVPATAIGPISSCLFEDKGVLYVTVYGMINGTIGEVSSTSVIISTDGVTWGAPYLIAYNPATIGDFWTESKIVRWRDLLVVFVRNQGKMYRSTSVDGKTWDILEDVTPPGLLDCQPDPIVVGDMLYMTYRSGRHQIDPSMSRAISSDGGKTWDASEVVEATTFYNGLEQSKTIFKDNLLMTTYGMDTAAGKSVVKFRTYSYTPPATGIDKQFIKPGTLGAVSNTYTGFLGLQITVLSAITITELQRWIVAGNSKPHILKIVDEKNRTITQVTLNTVGKPVGFASVAIKPVVLSPNTVYYILSQEVNGGDKWHHFTSVTGDPVATIGKPALMISTTVSVKGVSGNCFGPVGFRFRPTCQSVVAVDVVRPEPPTVAANDTKNFLSASHPLGVSEIIVSENNTAYKPYVPIQVGDKARHPGYWKFKTKAAAGRNESGVANSPAFTIDTVPSEPPSTSTIDEEFYGPFPSWIVAGQDIQGAFDQIGNDIKSVVFVPNGTYNISQTLKCNNKTNVSIIGEDPTKTIFKWTGPDNGVMLELNGTSYSRFNRLTFDGNKKVAVCVDQSWDSYKEHFDTGNEYSDNVFKDAKYGIRGGFYGYGFAETAVVRNRFIRCTIAGVSLGNFNALDLWIWNSYFEDCGTAITNTEGAGNFKVYKSLFVGSKVADITLKHTGEFSFRDNVSLNSKAFITTLFTANPSPITLQGNKILDPIDDKCINIQNEGPLVLIDNIIRSRVGAVAPVVRVQSHPDSHLFCMGNVFTVPNPGHWWPSPIDPWWFFDIENSIVDRNTLLDIKIPAIAEAPKKSTKSVIEISSASEIQVAINSGVGKIVHIPHGQYSITSTITIPPNSDVVIVGDGYGDRKPTRIKWEGSSGPMMNIVGPTKAILKDFTLDGGAKTVDIIQVTNSDQVGARVFAHQMELHSNITNLFVNDQKNVETLMTNSGFSNSEKSVVVTGGAKTVLFAGAQSDNKLSFEIKNKGVVLNRDLWYESNAINRYMLAEGEANFYMDGCHISSSPELTDPQFRIKDLNGKVVLFGNGITHDVLIEGNGSQAKVFALATLTGKPTLFKNTSSPVASTKRLLHRARTADQNTAGYGSDTVTDDVSPDVTTVGIGEWATLLDVSRKTHTPVIDSKPAGVTDLRIYRVWIREGINGLEIKQ